MCVWFAAFFRRRIAQSGIFNFIYTLFPLSFSFIMFAIFSLGILDTHGTGTRRQMARYIATSCIRTGRRSFFIAGKHTRDWHRTFHSYQTCYDNTTKNLCYFAWTIRGKFPWMTHHLFVNGISHAQDSGQGQRIRGKKCVFIFKKLWVLRGCLT